MVSPKINTMSKDQPFPFGAVVLSVVPVAGLLFAFAKVGEMQSSLAIQEKYVRYAKFWGGNPAEVYSHWLDMVLMSGNAIALAWLVGVEACVRSRPHRPWVPWLVRGCGVLAIVLSGTIAIGLDGEYGEGTVFIVAPIFFLPILVSSYYLLRQLAGLAQWRPADVAVLAAGFSIFHVAAQLYYEPSETGAPGYGIAPMWLGTVLVAVGCVVAQGIRTALRHRRASK
ncbi:MAG: hypothetical protein AB1705_23970 [Verrucomicrobiota bacterium]